jgi:hypothetical protein
VSNGYLFSVGGQSSTCYLSQIQNVYSAPFLPDGTLGAWSELNPIPTTQQETPVSAVYQETLIARLSIGNFLAPTEANGTLGNWMEDTPVPNDYDPGIAASDEGVYIIGGAGPSGLSAAIYLGRFQPADSSPPLITPTIMGTPGNNGWYVSNVTVSWSVSDPESAITSASGCDATTVNSDTAGTTLTCTATSAGGTSQQSVTIKRDATKPSISANLSPSSPASTGWYNIATGVPTVSFPCSDQMSGIDGSCPGPYAFGEGANQSYSASVSDKAGNLSSAGVSGINVDLTAPALNINGAANGTTFNVCSLPTRPSFVPTDNLSGLDGSQGDSWTTPATATGVGTYTYSAHATDEAGNTTSETRTYTAVYSSAFGGFLQPINSDGSSRFHLRSTVHVGFQLLCGSTPITNAVAKLVVKEYDGTPDPGVDEPISTAAATTGNQFRYDSTSQQYIFNLSTKQGYTNPDGSTSAFTVGTWTLSVLLDDGSYRSVNIQLIS